MKEHISLLKLVPLFNNINEEGILSLLNCLSAYTKRYRKNEIIIAAGDMARTIGIILLGDVQIIKEDDMGNRTILTEASQGDLFAESFACAKVKEVPVSVIASSPCSILHLNFQKIITTCQGACQFHSYLIGNMLEVLASKNMMLNQKIEYLSKRTTREKLMAYLEDEAKRSGSRKFLIPYKRQELADYLCVDRSAMTSELGRMQAEGLISFERNLFRIIH